MIIVAQRVSEAFIEVEKENIAEIKQGIVALIGIEAHDDVTSAERCIQKLLSIRIFEDTHKKMNLSCKDIQGGLLLVPQFTLVADTNTGNRPSFSKAAPVELSKPLFETLKTIALEKHPIVAFGEFGSDMQVNLTNNGPATFILSV